MTEDEMVGCHHWLNGYEFEQTLGDGEGLGSLACWSPWGRKELDSLVTEQQHLHIFLGCPASESPSCIWKIHLTVSVSETLVPFTTLESPKIQIPPPAHPSCFVT